MGDFDGGLLKLCCVRFDDDFAVAAGDVGEWLIRSDGGGQHSDGCESTRLRPPIFNECGGVGEA